MPADRGCLTVSLLRAETAARQSANFPRQAATLVHQAAMTSAAEGDFNLVCAHTS